MSIEGWRCKKSSRKIPVPVHICKRISCRCHLLFQINLFMFNSKKFDFVFNVSLPFPLMLLFVFLSTSEWMAQVSNCQWRPRRSQTFINVLLIKNHRELFSHFPVHCFKCWTFVKFFNLIICITFEPITLKRTNLRLLKTVYNTHCNKNLYAAESTVPKLCQKILDLQNTALRHWSKAYCGRVSKDILLQF